MRKLVIIVLFIGIGILGALLATGRVKLYEVKREIKVHDNGDRPKELEKMFSDVQKKLEEAKKRAK